MNVESFTACLAELLITANLLDVLTKFNVFRASFASLKLFLDNKSLISSGYDSVGWSTRDSSNAWLLSISAINSGVNSVAFNGSITGWPPNSILLIAFVSSADRLINPKESVVHPAAILIAVVNGYLIPYFLVFNNSYNWFTKLELAGNTFILSHALFTNTVSCTSKVNALLNSISFISFVSSKSLSYVCTIVAVAFLALGGISLGNVAIMLSIDEIFRCGFMSSIMRPALNNTNALCSGLTFNSLLIVRFPNTGDNLSTKSCRDKLATSLSMLGTIFLAWLNLCTFHNE